MLQQILKDMYIDPDVLEALNEEQKKTLFLKMRQEQVRRWKEREEKLEREGNAGTKPKSKKAHSKSVSWLLGRDGDVQVCVIGEVDEFRSSKLIYSEMGKPKVSNLHNNTRHQSDILRSSLVNRGSSEPENVPPQTPPGIQLHFEGVPAVSESDKQAPSSQESSADSLSVTHSLPLQVLEPEPLSSSTVESEEDSDSGGAVDSLRDSSLYYRPHLKFSRAPSIADRLRPLDTQQLRADPASIADRLRPPYSQEQGKGKDCQQVSTSQLAGPAGAGAVPAGAGPEYAGAGSEPAGAGCNGERDPCMARGRVAELMKTFNTPSPKGPKAAPSRPKPPVPTKPAHLQLLSPTSLR
ncbi:SH2 domain-containing protein 4A-like isoform X1 [Megalops cyprinoides]|uniref:SH2 domain-containing protein 4A-like isoform X1 n=1 Tax=Megalops cyprinoides TaxID=118141 RepID=UPI0018642AB0|nr:SH2 domain-containing protein 4A-like isoform X1 [Megalops cyprinoides]XP_036404067.1 SH2 domain-containing protein 4A-like isoform X1 [Megalops cyprinoides]